MQILYQGSPDTVIGMPDTPAETEACMGLLEAIAQEQGWQPGGQMRAYPEHSLHMVAVVGSAWAGALQMVVPNGDGWLPCLRVWPEVARLLTGRMAHGTALGLLPDYRGQFGLF